MTHTFAPVVVADDDIVSRRLIVRLLDKMNLRNPVVEAVDGEMAVDVLSTYPIPALVFLDADMPGRSGLAVLGWMRDVPRLRGVPVIMLTGSASLEEVDAAYALGVASYLVKPVGFAAVRDVAVALALPWALLAGTATE